MSEQAVDLRRSVQIVRRHRILVGTVTALGLLIGVAYSVLNVPMLTGTALVVLPQAVQNTGATANSPGSDSYMATQVVIATSDPVLSGALPNLSRAISLETLRSELQCESPTGGILSISARGGTAAQADATANAVAQSYIAYVGSAHSRVGRVQASVLESATSATGTSPIKHLLVDALIGAIVGALIGIIAALAIGRSDRRLRECDEISASIGVPILASFPVSHPKNAAGWTKLLEDHEPGALQGLRLRQALRQLEVVGVNINNGSEKASSSITIVSLSSDPGALALGPQLAVFAASLGIPTTLVVGPQQDATVTATLRTACIAPPPVPSTRPSHLRVTVYDGSDVDKQSDAVLTVVVTVVDDRIPQVDDTIRTASTVLGVSAGAATAEQLARLVSSAAANGREIVGILVADPEPSDRTSGRIPHVVRVGAAQGATQVAYTLDGHNNGDQKVNDPDQTVIFTAIEDNRLGPSTEIRR